MTGITSTADTKGQNNAQNCHIMKQSSRLGNLFVEKGEGIKWRVSFQMQSKKLNFDEKRDRDFHKFHILSITLVYFQA